MKLKAEKSVSEVIQFLENLAPSGTAESWDNVGLLVGDSSEKTKGAIVSIDLTPEAIEMAVQKGFRLIVNHHPCIFPKNKGLARLTSGNLAFEAARKGISVAAFHTNFDQCALEVVQAVSEGLHVQPKGRLFDRKSDLFLKLTTFIPAAHFEAVRLALSEAGAGHIGNYDSCSFSVSGEGFFRGNDATQPFIGKPGVLEKTKEVRLETILPKGIKDSVIAALLTCHPYEEVAYDLVPVEQGAQGEGLHAGHGYGFWGEFPQPKPFSDVIKDVKSLFNIHGFWITRPVPSSVKRIGFVAGKGASFLDSAAAAKCDLFITGEAGYHNALGGLKRGMAVMEVGHCESERFFVETVRNWLSKFGLESEGVDHPTQVLMV